MARPKTAAGPTPDALRQARSKLALIDAGGRRLAVNLSPAAAQHLAELRGSGRFVNDSEAIIEALATAAASERRKAARRSAPAT